MDRKKIICIVLVIILIGVALFYFSPMNRSYSIENATIDISVSEFGSIYVHEDYDYSFKGEYNGIYREIPLKRGEEFGFFNVKVDGAYYKVVENESLPGKHLKIYLYSDKDQTQKIKDCNVHVSYRYSMKNAVSLYDDVGVLQYKLWDKYWDKEINGLTATVHFPKDKNNTYYINPEKFTKTSYIDGDTLTIKTNPIPKGQVYELLALMPADDFYDNAVSAKNIPGNGRDMIIQNLNDSLEEVSFWDLVVNIYRALAILAPVSLVITYLRYGREPKVDYDGVYEREPPTDDSPEFVNAMFGTSATIGEPNRDGFEASILNMINGKIIDIEARDSDEADSKDLILTFNPDRKQELTSTESMVYDALSGFATDDVLNLSTLRDRLTNQSNAKWFVKRFDAWKKKVRDENQEKFKRYFNRKGLTISRYIEAIAFVLGIALFVIAMFLPTYETRVEAMKMAVVIGMTGIIAFFLPDDYFGKWSDEGRLIHLKWKNFEKFLQDNSLIEEHPPESIVIWKKYLIYGASLGITKKVYEAMKLHVPNISDYDNDGVFLYHSYGGFSTMDSAIRSGEYWADPPSDSGGSGGSGGFGGGSGGGGGGAF